MTAHSPDIARKAGLPHGAAVGLRLQERYGPYRAVPALRSGGTSIWQVSIGNAPAFTAQTRFGPDQEQISVVADFVLPLATVCPVLRGTGP